MTLKEKAIELYYKFYNRIEHTLSEEYSPHEKDVVKQCALAAVEFARQEFRDHCCAEIGTDGSPDDHFDAIKQEIEKL